MKIKKFLLSIVALMLVLLMSFSLAACKDDKKDNKDNKERNKSPEDIVNAYFQAEYIDFSAKDFCDCYHEKVFEIICDEDGKTKQEYIDEMQMYLDIHKDDLDDDYEQWSYSYKISKEFEPDFDGFYDYYNEKYNLEIEDCKGYEIEVVCDYVLDGEKGKRDHIDELYLCKVDGEWHLVLN